jgi:Ca2+-binding EF-hand superfamily protein
MEEVALMHEAKRQEAKFRGQVPMKKTTLAAAHKRTLNATSTVFARWAMPIVICHLMLGMVVLAWLEAWTQRDALYFCVTLLTTVGYGDLAPKTHAAKVFCCVYVVCGISIVSASLGVVIGRMYAKVTTNKMFSSFGSDHTGRMLSAMSSMVAVIITGAFFAHRTEGWAALDSIYWAVITCSSVGLGDLVVSAEHRSFSTCYLLIAVGAFASAAASIAHVFADMEVQHAITAFLAEGVNEDLIVEMDEDGGGSVDKYEFLSYLLVHTGKVTKHEIQGINNMFSSLDRDGSGTIDKDDIRAAGAGKLPAMSDSDSSKKKVNEAKRSWYAFTMMQEHMAIVAPMLKMQDASYLKAVDAVIASTALALTDLALYGLDASAILPMKFFAPPMLASSIIFFGGAKPPPPAAFITGTIGSFVVGSLLQQFNMGGSTVVQCLAAACLLLFFKLSGSFFVPTVGLCAFLAQSSHLAGHTLMQPLMYLFFPWSSGHLVMYFVASSLSTLRQSIRVQITTEGWKRKLHEMGDGPEREKHLREIFDKYDTSGDGQLDASELKLALRSITGMDVEMEDCERVIRSMDTDGDGVIDFHEFVLALDEHV